MRYWYSVLSFLNRGGLSVAYTTIGDVMKAIGNANMEMISKRIKEGWSFGWMWDNNVMFENKTGRGECAIGMAADVEGNTYSTRYLRCTRSLRSTFDRFQ